MVRKKIRKNVKVAKVNFYNKDIRILRKLIKLRQINKKSLIRLSINKIEDENKKINALRYVAKDSLKSKILNGKLSGIPFSVKDNINVLNMPRSDGTALTNIDNSSFSSHIVDLILNEGGICVGKSNMSELGKSYFTENKAFGRTENPFKAGYTAGGSSGGDGAAVASNFCKFGIAGDLGGSVRVPANFCGLFGFIPTNNTVSDYLINGSTVFVARLFRSLGILAQSIDDLEYLYPIISQLNAKDPFQFNSNKPQLNIQPNKFIYYSNIGNYECSDEIKIELENTVKAFKMHGLKGVEYTPDFFLEALQPFFILAGQATLFMEDLFYKSKGLSDEFNDINTVKSLKRLINKKLPELSLPSLMQSLNKVYELRIKFYEIFNKFDFILSPVAAVSPPLHCSNIKNNYIKVNKNIYQSYEAFVFSIIFNVFGAPCIAFPTSINHLGLPLGLQITGNRFSEKMLFSILKKSGFKKRLMPTQI